MWVYIIYTHIYGPAVHLSPSGVYAYNSTYNDAYMYIYTHVYTYMYAYKTTYMYVCLRHVFESVLHGALAWVS